jgi:hypothetical protein
MRYPVRERFIDEGGHAMMKSSAPGTTVSVAAAIVAPPGMRRLSGMLAVRRIVER